MLRMIFIVILSIVTGAASAKDADPVFALDAESGNGILVVSLTMPIMEGAYTQYAVQKYHYRSVDKPRLFQKTILLYRKMWFKKEVISDFADQFGTLAIIELPAGNYAIEGWTFLNGTGAEFRPDDFGSHPFQIKAGRATYVGQMDLSIRTGDNVFGGEVASRPVVEFRDATQRDLGVLNRKIPSITPAQVDIALLSGGAGKAPESKSTIPPPAVVPTQ